jgi:hypothetical protein
MEHVMKLNLKNLEGYPPLSDFVVLATVLLIIWLAFELIYYWATMVLPYFQTKQYVPPTNWADMIH